MKVLTNNKKPKKPKPVRPKRPIKPTNPSQDFARNLNLQQAIEQFLVFLDEKKPQQHDNGRHETTRYCPFRRSDIR